MFENYPVDEAARSDASLPVVGWQVFDQTHYPLTIGVFVREVLQLRLAWDEARLGGPEVARFGGHLRTLLLDVVAHPDRRLGELALLPSHEVAELAAWNETERAYPQELCVHQLIAEQVARTPDRLVKWIVCFSSWKTLSCISWQEVQKVSVLVSSKAVLKPPQKMIPAMKPPMVRKPKLK